jgi:hypothetical protein
VLNGYRSLIEIDIIHGNSQHFAYAAAQPPEQPDNNFVSQKLSCQLKLFYF